MALDLALLSGGYNARIGRYGFSRSAAPGADIALDQTAAYAVMSAVVIRQNSYWADRSMGSILNKLKSLTSRTPSQAVASALAAVQPLERAPLSLIRSGTTATASRGTFQSGRPNALFLDLNWTTPGGLRGSGSVGV